MPKYRIETDAGAVYEIETDGPANSPAANAAKLQAPNAAAQKTRDALTARYPQYLGPNANTDASLMHLTGVDRPAGEQASELFRGIWDSSIGGLLRMGKQALTPALAPDSASTSDKVAFALGGPVGVLGKEILGAHADTAAKAWDAAKRGEGLEAAGYAGATVLPGVGPFAASMGEQLGSGHAAGAAGSFVGGVGIPEAVRRIPSVKLGLPEPAALTPEEIATNDFARRHNVRLDAATERGSDLMRFAQKQSAKLPGGYKNAKQFYGGQSQDMHSAGAALADQVAPEITPLQAGAETGSALRQDFDTRTAADTAAALRQGRDIAGQLGPASSPETAATDVRAGNMRTVTDLHRAANAHYAEVWRLEQDPANIYEVPVGTNEEGKPRYASMPLPVPMAPIKAALLPVAREYQHTLPIAIQRASPGLHAIMQILAGDDFKPASAAEKDLGALKQVLRGGEDWESSSPALRDVSQGLAARAVKELQNSIDQTVMRAQRTVAAGTAPRAAMLPPGQAATLPASSAVAVGDLFGGGDTSAAAGGSATTIEVPGTGRTYPAKYALRELDDVQASHNGQTFQRNPNYGLVNDRDYTRVDNQGKVLENSTPDKFRPAHVVNDAPTALSGPPIIDAEGNALGGNGRTMILQRVYESNSKGAAYRAELERKAAQFGLDPEQVRKMRNPVLVREVEASALPDVASKQKAITDFNVKETQELRPSEKAIADSRRVSPSTLEDLSRRLDEKGADASLADVLEGPQGGEILDGLIKDGVVSANERPALAEGQVLSKAGKDRIHSLLLGRFFRDPAQLDAAPLSIRKKLERMAAPLASVEGKQGWGLTDTIQGALDLIHEARAHGAQTIDDYVRNGGLFNDQRFNQSEIDLANRLQSQTQTELVRAARQYAGDAGYADGGSLFGDAPTPERSFAESFGAAPREAAPLERAQVTAPVGPKQRVVGTPVGSEAVARLQAGRKYTALKHDAIDTLKKMREEPVQLYQQLTTSRDAAVDFLRDVEEKSPGTLGGVARAFVDGLIDDAAADGGLRKSVAIQERWRNVGPEMKRILFGNKVSALDQYFEDAKNLEQRTKADIVNHLPSEPVALFNRLTKAGDGGVHFLEDALRRSPESRPKLARALVQELLDRASDQGKSKFSHADALFADWERIGDKNKDLLFQSPELVKEFDNFFRLAKRLNENPNPSGSAYGVALNGLGLLTIKSPLAAGAVVIGNAALSQLLFNPQFRSALTKGLKLPLGNKAAAAIALGNIVRAAGDKAQPEKQ